MFLSRACEYAVQALLHLNMAPSQRFMPVAGIARALRLSPSFLAKVLGLLVSNRLLMSQKGPGGGVRLARPASEINLLEVVEAVDGLEWTSRCMIGLPKCGSGAPCPFHDMWGPMRDRIITRLSTKSLEELTRELRRSTPRGRRALAV